MRGSGLKWLGCLTNIQRLLSLPGFRVLLRALLSHRRYGAQGNIVPRNSISRPSLMRRDVALAGVRATSTGVPFPKITFAKTGRRISPPGLADD
jgi:hypothetical protein